MNLDQSDSGNRVLLQHLLRDDAIWVPGTHLRDDGSILQDNTIASKKWTSGTDFRWTSGHCMREPVGFIEWRILHDGAIPWPSDKETADSRGVSSILQKLYSFRSSVELQDFMRVALATPLFGVKKEFSHFLAATFSPRGPADFALTVVEPSFSQAHRIETADEVLILNRVHSLPTERARMSWRAMRRLVWRHVDAMWDQRGRRAFSALFVIDERLRKATSKDDWLGLARHLMAGGLVDDCLPHRTADEKQQIVRSFAGFTTLRKIRRSLSR